MKPYYETELGRLYHGSCLDIMLELDNNSIDTIITDPPYALEFMGKGWDKVLPSVEIWKEALRIAKPGATLMAFGGTRTYHRLTCAIEDAGWEIRDCIMYCYGSGFPKATDISKQLDKKAGKYKKGVLLPSSRNGSGNMDFEMKEKTANNPQTPEAQLWNGWKSHGLKPAYEPIVIAMKPNDGTYANNALKWGVAGLNIDGGRIGVDREHEPRQYDKENASEMNCGDSHFGKNLKKSTNFMNQGRFPANIILDGSDEVLKLFPETKSGSLTGQPRVENKSVYGKAGSTIGKPGFHNGDSGSAARFFYCAKASKAERNAGCQDLENHNPCYESHRPNYKNTKGIDTPYAGTGKSGNNLQNNHPTVKPLALMEYLCKITETPTKGIVIDMFGGSGTSGVACEKLGRKWILIEKELEYCKIIVKRIESERKQLKLF